MTNESDALIARYEAHSFLDDDGDYGVKHYPSNDGYWVKYSDHAARLAALEAEVTLLRKELDLAVHKCITCGVAAEHPDATLTTRGAYASKWDSPQAERVRQLRARCDAATKRAQAAEQDARRIDWIAQQDLTELRFGLIVDRPHDGDFEVTWGWPDVGMAHGTTLRDAIDAALAQEKK